MLQWLRTFFPQCRQWYHFTVRYNPLCAQRCLQLRCCVRQHHCSLRLVQSYLAEFNIKSAVVQSRFVRSWCWCSRATVIRSLPMGTDYRTTPQGLHCRDNLSHWREPFFSRLFCYDDSYQRWSSPRSNSQSKISDHCYTEASYHRSCCDMDFRRRLGWDLEKGSNHLYHYQHNIHSSLLLYCLLLLYNGC